MNDEENKRNKNKTNVNVKLNWIFEQRNRD